MRALKWERVCGTTLTFPSTDVCRDALPTPQRIWAGSFLGREVLVKQRFPKRYRHPALDAKLTASRLRQARVHLWRLAAAVCVCVWRRGELRGRGSLRLFHCHCSTSGGTWCASPARCVRLLQRASCCHYTPGIWPAPLSNPPQEARGLLRARRLGVLTPALVHVDFQTAALYLQRIPGVSVKAALQAGLPGGEEGEQHGGRLTSVQPCCSQALQRAHPAPPPNTHTHIRLPATQALMREIGRTIARLHDGALVHGDLTTSNLLLREGDGALVSGGHGGWRGAIRLPVPAQFRPPHTHTHTHAPASPPHPLPRC